MVRPRLGEMTINSGSIWRRWEPHVHFPGTVLNDQYSGADAWESNLAMLESRTPIIEAIGVTDYYSLDTGAPPIYAPSPPK